MLFYIINFYIKNCLKLSIFNISLKIINGFSPVISIYFFQLLINEILYYINGESELKKLIILFLIQILLLIIPYSINHLLAINEQILTNKVTKILTNEIFFKTSQTEFLNFENPEFYDSYQRVISNKENLNNAFNALTYLVSALISLISSLALLTIIDNLVVIIVILGVIPYFVIQLKFSKKNFLFLSSLIPIHRKEQYISFTLSQRDMLKETIIFNSFDFFVKRWNNYFHEYTDSEINFLKIKTKYLFLSEIILVLTYAFSGIIVILNLQTSTTAGGVLATLQAIQLLQSNLSLSTRYFSDYKNSSYFIKDFLEFVKTPGKSEKEYSVSNKEELRIKNIKIKDLSFKYPNMSENILKNINLEINYGEKVAIVGQNGSGKTTLMKTILGLYSNKSENIKINNIKFNDLDIKKYQEKISVLFQDFVHYELTVNENISFENDENYDNSRIKNAINKVGLTEFVENLPHKYDSVLGRQFEGGNELSGGQWQKIALARALYRGSDLIVLDEPSSALDPIAEKEIMNNLLNIYEGSILFVTHRLKIAALADRIIVLKNGVIIEEGTHQELINKKGYYNEMYNAQNNIHNIEFLVH
ncbi:ABC transporter ATP-binding protein [Lysinibacillus sphaericus]|uniref:ABC transporter ATP-binding protein n=1 Tax=Lysinibacillus sphaericus TaxID=1421 RepID=UPI001CBFCF10|nr:ATP-binding cassette domain-containing protein [Lysinibacillus sphaericus]